MTLFFLTRPPPISTLSPSLSNLTALQTLAETKPQTKSNLNPLHALQKVTEVGYIEVVDPTCQHQHQV